MLLLDVVLTAGGILGLFLSILYLIGYFKRKNKAALILVSISLILALISISPLIYFALGFLEGEIPLWGWIFPIPITLFILITIFRMIYKRYERGGGGD